MSELAFVAQVARHGARTPKKLYHFNRHLWDPETLTQVTGLGIKQHFILGQTLRNKYINHFPLLSPKNLEEEVAFLTTSKTRTVASAWAQALGLYLDHNPFAHVSNSLVFDSKDQKVLREKANTLTLPEVPIQSEKLGKEKILHGYKPSTNCKINLIRRRLKSSKEYLSKEEFLKKEYLPGLSKKIGVNLNSIKKASSFHGVVYSDIAHGYSLPKGLSRGDYEFLDKLHAWAMHFTPFSDAEALKSSCSGFFTELIENMYTALEGKGPKLKSYVAHDNTIIAFSNVLKYGLSQQPPYASTLVFELYKNKEVKIYYNEHPVKLSYCDPCTLPNFHECLMSYVDSASTHQKLSLHKS